MPAPLKTLSFALICLCGLAACKKQPEANAPLRVAAATDLQLVFQEFAARFEKATGRHVDLTFGSSGQLAQQLGEGAPFDLFAAANASYADQAIKSGACDAASKESYARGRLVLWTPKSIAEPHTLGELRDGRFRKIALANPEHAPYGRAAKQALGSAGVWDALGPKLVYAENVQQALQFARSGNADSTLTALSLASRAGEGNILVIELDQYGGLDQSVVVCTRGKATQAARDFARGLLNPEGRALLEQYGFIVPSLIP